MAKENREAEHMLGQNEPKQNDTNDMTTPTQQRASANKRLKQCFMKVPLSSMKFFAFMSMWT